MAVRERDMYSRNEIISRIEHSVSDEELEHWYSLLAVHNSECENETSSQQCICK